MRNSIKTELRYTEVSIPRGEGTAVLRRFIHLGLSASLGAQVVYPDFVRHGLVWIVFSKLHFMRCGQAGAGWAVAELARMSDLQCLAPITPNCWAHGLAYIPRRLAFHLRRVRMPARCPRGEHRASSGLQEPYAGSAIRAGHRGESLRTSTSDTLQDLNCAICWAPCHMADLGLHLTP